MDPSPVHTTPQTYDIPIKTEERVRPIPALAQQPPQRVQRYKDKFQALRERYESVISTHTESTRAVQRATEKEQHLQAEINMLLDAALAQSQSPHSQQSASTPIPTAAVVPPPPPTTTAPQSTTSSTTPTLAPTHAQLSPLDSNTALPSLAPGSGLAHMNGHSSSVPLPHPHPHPHAHLHGHGYAANHAPPPPPPPPSSSAPAPSSTNERDPPPL